MTPHAAALWLRRFARWRQCELSPLAYYQADMFGAHIVLGEWGKVLQMARDRHYFDRRLCIFVRRIVRLVDGFQRPACGWCCDTGGLPQREGPPAICDCAAGTAIIRGIYRPRTELDRRNLAAARRMSTSADRSARWQRRLRS